MEKAYAVYYMSQGGGDSVRKFLETRGRRHSLTTHYGTVYGMLLPDTRDLVWLLLFLVYALAIFSVVHVLRNYRTAQGAIGWIIGLISFPYVTLPLYYLLGRYRFEGYVAARRVEDDKVTPLIETLARMAGQWICDPPSNVDELKVITQLVRLPFTHSNRCELLIDGRQTYQSMFDAIRSAQHYILLEFYIIRDDNVGRKLSDLLLERLGAGVRVYFLYDDIGSLGLSRFYIGKLSRAGAEVRSFNEASKRPKRLQINFRNHRKILVIDGQQGFVGGLNIGLEYLGAAAKRAPWRDTHVRLEGPSVLALQLVFSEDWYWSANEIPTLSWSIQPQTDLAEAGKTPAGKGLGKAAVFILPTSAADEFDTCELFFLNAIGHARERIWIASPYFVPDLQIINALQLAALRGVDVRILIPVKPDNLLVGLAAYTYLEMAARCGIKIYRFNAGFMHQKVLLVDDRYAGVGTANLDNRSLRLNFEVTAVVCETTFVRQIESMLVDDFAHAQPFTLDDYERCSPWFVLACRGARLMAPLL